MTVATKTGGRNATQGVIEGRIALSVGRPDRMPEPPGFRWTALAAVARLESGHTPSRSKPEYWDGDVPWIGIRDATGNHGKTIGSTAQTITRAGLENSSARLLPAGTVCLSRTASVGYVVQMGVPMATSQDFVNWVCGPQLSPEYLKYVMLGEQDSIRRFAHGTTHQTMYYPEAKAFHVLLPSRPVQDAVAAVLGALDDKIAANTTLAKLADELIRAQWARYCAEASDTTTIGAIAESPKRLVDPNAADEVPYVGLEHVPRRLMWLTSFGSSSDVTSTKTEFAASDVLFGKLRPYFHKVVSASRAGICSTDIIVLRAREPQMAGFVLAAASSDTAVQRCSGASEGTRMPRTSWKDLAAIEVPWAGEAPARQLASAVDAVRGRVDAAIEESQTLAHTRDALLPLLMSGKLRVKDAERVVEDVV